MYLFLFNFFLSPIYTHVSQAKYHRTKDIRLFHLEISSKKKRLDICSSVTAVTLVQETKTQMLLYNITFDRHSDGIMYKSGNNADNSSILYHFHDVGQLNHS